MACKVYAQGGDSWVVYEGGEGPEKDKHIVFVSGDDEYRSGETMPALAKILAYRHGFKCRVLFAINPETGKIDPNYQKNIPGLDTLEDAGLMIIQLRFRELSKKQRKYVLDYLESGKTIIGIRTYTQALRYPNNSPYYKYSFDSDIKVWEGALAAKYWERRGYPTMGPYRCL